jgi:ribosomal protein S18 acetylase RimI-like enzyme
LSQFRIELLKKQDRSDFDCGTDVLNRYLQTRAGQEQRKKFCTCYLAVDTTSEQIAGFYTLSSSSIDLDDLPGSLQKKLPRYAQVPVARVGRLAVDVRYHGKGLGAGLIADSIKRVVSSGIGCYAIVVDAKDLAAIAFYRHNGFDVLRDRPDVLYLSIATAISAMEN